MIERFKWRRVPAVAILPLGTGNDLSRSLNWGSGFSVSTIGGCDIGGAVDGEDLEECGDGAALVWWKGMRRSDSVGSLGFADDIGASQGGFRIRLAFLFPQNRNFNCYFSIGSDAAIALRFHTMRERNPSLFNSQLGNKVWYAAVGSGETFNPSTPKLSESVELFIDGAKCELHDAISVTCLNIPYYAGGSLPLGVSEDLFSSSDGILEVIGFRNILHCATTLVPLQTGAEA